MNLGTGIFLSALVLAVVALYGITKDRWKWRGIAKRAALISLGAVLLGVLVGGGAYLYHRLPTPVSTQTVYAGLRLGMSQDEVLYLRGYPPSVLGEAVSDPKWKGFHVVLETNKLPEGKTAADYRYWSYRDNYRTIEIVFNDERNAVVAVQCYSDDKLGRCPAIAGVQDGEYETNVLRKLGDKPTSKLNGTTKTLTYPDLGIRLWLAREQVYRLEIATRAYVQR